jgi:cytoskeletal protein CcmA (bactofilin family)
MMWQKKPVTTERQTHVPVLVPPGEPIEEKPMVEPAKPPVVAPTDLGRTQLGRTVTFKGDVSGSEDLMIFGQFEGTVNVQGHCLTVGPEGKVRAEIQAARVVIHGSVHGNISVRERIEIYKTGHVVGDLTAPGISIEDGAFYKGKIEILKEAVHEAEDPLSPQSPKQTSTLLTRMTN